MQASTYRVLCVKKVDLIYFLFAIMPLIDSLNGFLIKNTSFSEASIGQIYRIVVMAVVVVMACSGGIKRKVIETAGVFVSMLLIMSLIHFFVGLTVSITDDLYLNMFQWSFAIVMILGMVVLMQKGIITKNIVERILDTYAWLVPLTLLIPYALGLGSYTYSGELGYKGFFYATNGISLLSAVLSIYVLYNLFNKFSIAMCIKTGLVFATCVLLGTKSAAFSIVVAFLFLVWLAFSNKFAKGIKVILWVVVIGIIVFVLLNTLMADKISDIISRYNYMAKINDYDLSGTVTSGRTVKASEIWATFINSNDWIFLLKVAIGTGSIGLISEMDFFDLFFSYGFVGVVLFIYVFITMKKDLVLNPKNLYGFIFWFVVVYSFVVGHVFTNALSSTTVALITCMLVKPPGKV